MILQVFLFSFSAAKRQTSMHFNSSGDCLIKSVRPFYVSGVLQDGYESQVTAQRDFCAEFVQLN